MNDKLELRVLTDVEFRSIINTILAYKTLNIISFHVYFNVNKQITIHGDKIAISTLTKNFKKKKYKTVTYKP